MFCKLLVVFFDLCFKYFGIEGSEYGFCFFIIYNGFEIDIVGCMKCDYWLEIVKLWI